MKFGIIVSAGPYTHQASDTAYQFSKAVLELSLIHISEPTRPY